MSNPLWFDEQNTRRGDLSADGFQQAIDNAVAILLFLAASGPSNVAAVAAGVTGMNQRRAKIMLDRLVEAGGATVNSGTYTGVLAEAEA